MSHTLSAVQEVFRGMQVEAVPLRLRSGSPGTKQAAAPVPPGRAPDEERRIAREQGWREGHEQGVRSGHADGLQQGRAAAAEEVRKAVEQAVAEALRPLVAERQRVGQLAQAVHATMDEALAVAFDEMLALCYETICRVLGATAVQEEAVRAQLGHLLRLHGNGEAVALHVHPQDADLLAGQGGDRCGTPRWIADPQVKLGGCIVRSTAGGLDARLETMLEACKVALLEARARRTAVQPAAGEPA